MSSMSVSYTHLDVYKRQLVVNASMETLVQVLHEHKKPVAAVMEV